MDKTEFIINIKEKMWDKNYFFGKWFDQSNCNTFIEIGKNFYSLDLHRKMHCKY
jgi:hypothetical protein